MKKEAEIIRAKISLLQKILDLLRRLLRLQTKVEKLGTELMVRQLAVEEGVDPDLIAAVIWCESNMNPRAIHRNDGTTDYGLCQFNNYWYGSIISPELALNNPEYAVRVMCRRFKAGHGSDWICYRSGKYKKYFNV